MRAEKSMKRGNNGGNFFCFVGLLLVVFLSTAAAQDIPTSNAVPAERIKLQYSNGIFSLLGRSPIRKVIPPSQELPAVQKDLSGFWYELRGPTGIVRYRRIIQTPVLQVFEGPDPGQEAPSRKEGLPPQRVFSLLVPSPEIGDELVLVGSPLEPNTQGEPAEELAKITLIPIIG